MTGETANGRSTRPSTSARPRNSCRTSTTANARPKTVLTAVATSVIPSVSPNARWASGEMTACQNGVSPAAKRPAQERQRRHEDQKREPAENRGRQQPAAELASLPVDQRDQVNGHGSRSSPRR